MSPLSSAPSTPQPLSVVTSPSHAGARGPVRVRGPHPGCPLTPLSPQRSDPQLLAQFYHADEELSQVAAELDSLDGRKDPQRCTLLVSQFRSCQVRGGAGGGAGRAQGLRGAQLGAGGGGQSW